MYAKYHEALRLMELVKGRDIAVKQSNPNTYCGDDTLHQHWDNLFRHLHKNFDFPEVFNIDNDQKKLMIQLLKECRHNILNKSTVEDAIKKIPPDFSDVMFPVAIARHLLHDYQVMISFKRLSTFSEFHRRYGFFILNC